MGVVNGIKEDVCCDHPLPLPTKGKRQVENNRQLVDRRRGRVGAKGDRRNHRAVSICLEKGHLLTVRLGKMLDGRVSGMKGEPRCEPSFPVHRTPPPPPSTSFPNPNKSRDKWRRASRRCW